jgi:hypothetical protein
MEPSTELLHLLCRVIWGAPEQETQLLSSIAAFLAAAVPPADRSAPRFAASASQLGTALNAVPLWAKWKKLSGKTLAQLLAMDSTGAFSTGTRGKEKVVVLRDDLHAIALSSLYEACEQLWRPSRTPSAWAKCELARMILLHQYSNLNSSTLLRYGAEKGI